jgi:hypothetical protein
MRMMNEFEAQVLSDLSVLKTQMNGLMGDGNGGRIADLEWRMDRQEQNWQRAKVSPPLACCLRSSKLLLRRGCGDEHPELHRLLLVKSSWVFHVSIRRVIFGSQGESPIITA